jgi:6-phosphogluconolactonase (cycloisomerase 2 family)
MKKHSYLLLLLVLTSHFVFSQDSTRTYLFVGSYTSGEGSEGIYVYDFNSNTGQLKEIEREGNLVNPSFITLSPNGNFLYACTDTKLKEHGSISAFAIDSLTGKITFINKQTTGGQNPVHLVVDSTNNFVIVSNYSDSGIATFECNSNGSLNPYIRLIEFEGSSVIKGRQDHSHIHSCNFSTDNKYIFAPDLGTDQIHVLSFNSEYLLTVIDSLTINVEKGSGPRHFTFHPNGTYAYCVNELNGSVSFYTQKDGMLSLINKYNSYEHKQLEYASSDIHISPDGKYLYVSNRQEEHSISIYKINQTNGKLSLITHHSTGGTIPRSFIIDPSGQFLIVANQTSNTIVVFNRNTENGLLTKTDEIINITSPSCLKMRSY